MDDAEEYLKAQIDGLLGDAVGEIREDSFDNNNVSLDNETASYQNSTLAIEANTNARKRNKDTQNINQNIQNAMNAAFSESAMMKNGNFADIGRGLSMGGSLPGYSSLKSSAGDIIGIVPSSESSKLSSLAAERERIGDKELYTTSELNVVEQYNNALKEANQNLIEFTENGMDRLIKAAETMSKIDLSNLVENKEDSMASLLNPEREAGAWHRAKTVFKYNFPDTLDLSNSSHKISDYQLAASPFINEAINKANALPMRGNNNQSLIDSITEIFHNNIKENENTTGDDIYKNLQPVVDAVDDLLEYAKNNLVDESELIQQALNQMDQRDTAALYDDSIRRREQESVLSAQYANAPRVGVNNKHSGDQPYYNKAEDYYNNVQTDKASVVDRALRETQIAIENQRKLEDEIRKAEEERLKAEKERLRKEELNAKMQAYKDELKNKLSVMDTNSFKNGANSFESEWMQLRNLKNNFLHYSGIVDDKFREEERDDDGEVIGYHNRLTNTVFEDKIANETAAAEDNLLDAFDSLKEDYVSIKRMREALNSSTATDERKAEILDELNEKTDSYNEAVKNLTKAFSEANKNIVTDLADDVKKDAENGANFSGQRLRNAKYAWKRNTEQTAILQAEGELTNYNASGYLKDSVQKTLFNRAVGYRQRQGLIGLFSNLGYNFSGVGASLGLGAFATGIEKATKAIIQFGKASLEAYGQIEQVKTNLGIVYGSQSEANSTFNEIAAYSVKSPFGVETVSQFAVQLKQSGVYASELMTTLKEIGDVAGGNQQKFGNIANAFAQIEANGKATTRQLREFATAGIPIYAQLSKQLGKSVEQIRTMTEQGQISSSIIEQAFAQLTGEGGMFNNAVNIGAKTFAARKQNLSDIWQLAKSEFGEWLFQLGPTSATNDSLGNEFINLLENIGSSVDDIFEVINVKDDVENTEKREQLLVSYQEKLAKAETNDNKENIEKYTKLIDRLTQSSSISQDRANKVRAYDKGIQEAEDLQNSSWFYKHIIFTLSPFAGSEQSKYRNSLEWVQNYKNDKTISDVEQLNQKGFDVLDKSTRRGTGTESIAKTPTSLYLLKQESDELWKQTAKGKKEILDLQKKEWDQMVDEYNKLSPLIDSSANLVKGSAVTAEQFDRLLSSGIMIAGDKRSFAPEDLANNGAAYNRLASQEDKDKLRNTNNQNYNDLVATSLSLMNRNVDDLSQEALDAFTKYYEAVLGGSVEIIEKDGHKYFDTAITEADTVGKNSEEAVNTINTAYDALITTLTKNNPELSQQISSYLGTTRTKTGQAKNYADTHDDTTKDPYPLWQRIINSSLGVDLNLFKNRNTGYITNGNQAMDAYQRSMEKQTIKSIMTSAFSTMGIKSTLKNIVRGDTEESNLNSVDKSVRQIDWKQTYKNMTAFATALKTSAEVTRAYADSLSASQSALEDFLASSITQTEEPANIYDNNYQQLLGNYAKNIKATDANAYDLMFEDLGRGVIRIKENATELAQELLRFTTQMKNVISTTAEFKESIKQSSDSVRNNQLSAGLLSKYGSNGTIRDLNIEDSATYIQKMTEILTAKASEEGSPYYGKSANQLQKVIDLFVNDGGVGTEIPSGFRTDEYALINKSNKEIQQAKNIRASDEYKELDAKITKLKQDLKTAKSEIAAFNIQGELSDTQNRFNQLEKQAVTYEKAGKGDSEAAELAKTNNNELINAYNNNAETLRQLFEELYKEIKSNRSLENETAYQKLVAPMEYYNSPWLEGQKRDINSFKQQYMLNQAGVSGDWDQFINSRFYKTDGSVNSQNLKTLINSKGFEKASLEDQTTLSLAAGLDEDTLQGLDVSVLEKIEKAFSNVTEEEMKMADAAKSMQTTFEDLGKTALNTFKTSMLNGFTSSLSTAGANLYNINEGLMTADDATEGFGNSWKKVGVEMLNSLGPAMAQAGLALIEKGAKDDSWSLIIAGASMAAAGGVTSFLGGYLGASNDEDKTKEEEQRLQDLRSLLQQIVEQAKTDAQYYESNMRHQTALSIQSGSEISVNDAIITPNGNVVSTHPDDYLIATKTPGSLINSGSSSSSTPNITFNLVNESGEQMEVRSSQTSTDSDGNIDIKVMIASVVGEKIANGDMDGYFSARDTRLKGRSYSG